VSAIIPTPDEPLTRRVLCAVGLTVAMPILLPLFGAFLLLVWLFVGVALLFTMFAILLSPLMALVGVEDKHQIE
jgi:hypothetical protein